MRIAAREPRPSRAAAGAGARRSDAARRRSPGRGAGTRRLPGTARACRSRSCAAPDARSASARARAAALRLPVSSVSGRSSGANQRREVARVLLGEQLRRRHHRGLKAGFDGAHGGERGDDGLAAADVALHEPQHRTGLREIALDLLPRARCAPVRSNGSESAEALRRAIARRRLRTPSPDRAESRGAAAAGSADARAAPRTRGAAAPDGGRSRAASRSASGGGRCT